MMLLARLKGQNSSLRGIEWTDLRDTMLLDSSAWIEIFEGSSNGKKIEQIAENEDIYTSMVSISEITNWCRKNNLDENYYIGVIEENSGILSFTKESLILAGIINFERKKIVKNWGMLDSMIYAIAKLNSIIVLTTDHHFLGLEYAEVID